HRHDRPHGPPAHRPEHHLLARPEEDHITPDSWMKHRVKTTSKTVVAGLAAVAVLTGGTATAQAADSPGTVSAEEQYQWDLADGKFDPAHLAHL
ncbi:hypothetical protein ACGFYF_40565, partial [Streptomyces lavendulae]|uniref:hypothetical protein n=1 Tax=Streptomyces lavendulae TaxID=1914 RepID=UPI00371EEB10